MSSSQNFFSAESKERTRQKSLISLAGAQPAHSIRLIYLLCTHSQRAPAAAAAAAIRQYTQ